MPSAPPPEPELDPPALGGEPVEDRARSRRVLMVSAILALGAMGAVVAIAFVGRGGEEASGRGFDPVASREAGGDLPARAPWPEEGCTPDPGKPPRLVFVTQGDLDFGEVKQGVTKTLEYRFRSSGTGPLCIRQVNTGCGCVKADLLGDRRRFDPGEEGVISVVLDSTGRHGAQRKSVSIYTNDPESPIHRFDAIAEINAGLIAYPVALDFGRVAQGVAARAQVTLRSPKQDAAWEVTEILGKNLVDGQPLAYAFSVTEAEDPAATLREVTITHPGLGDVGPFQDELHIRTTHPERSELVVKAYMVVVPPIAPTPQRVVLGFVSPARPGAQRVQLTRGNPDLRFQVTGLSWAGRSGRPLEGAPPFAATAGQSEDGGWWIDVSYDGQPRAAGPVSATLIVQTDLPDALAIQVPCFATVEGAAEARR
jgi:hypothetical protein